MKYILEVENKGRVEQHGEAETPEEAEKALEEWLAYWHKYATLIGPVTLRIIEVEERVVKAVTRSPDAAELRIGNSLSRATEE